MSHARSFFSRFYTFSHAIIFVSRRLPILKNFSRRQNVSPDFEEFRKNLFFWVQLSYFAAVKRVKPVQNGIILITRVTRDRLLLTCTNYKIADIGVVERNSPGAPCLAISVIVELFPLPCLFSLRNRFLNRLEL